MPVRLRLDGMADLKAALQRLPVELRDEARPLVQGAADEAQATIAAAYPRTSLKHAHLADGLEQRRSESGAGVNVQLRNKSKLAAIFEYGTEGRHDALGRNRGSMPAAKVFIPTVIAARARLVAGLVALVERAGLTVRGG